MVRTFTDDAFLGMEVGPYRLARLLGRGGMGRVYLGIQPAVGGRVAIKVLSDDACEKPELIERFFTEARAVNLIRHEGIVRTLDFTEITSGRPAIVMELIEGRTLREIIQAGKVPLGGAVQVMIEVLTALAAAHDIGIVHRDLKPDNIIVTPSGRAKILDFGIAKLAPDVPGAGPRTKTGAMLGTPHYMSPEQIGRGTVDARSDVYAAGVVMFEVVTRRKPFEGLSDFELQRAHVESPPPSPRELRHELPHALSNAILRALSKRRGDRFASANEMANALHDASAELPAAEWRSLALHGRMLTRSATPPASIPPGPLATGPLPAAARPVRRAAPHEVTDRPPPPADGAPAARDRARRARPDESTAVPAQPPAHAPPGVAPPGAPVDPDASAPAIGKQQRDHRRTDGTRPSSGERGPARSWRRAIVPVVAACAGGAAVALVIHLLGTEAPPPPSRRAVPPLASIAEPPLGSGSGATSTAAQPSPGGGSSVDVAAARPSPDAGASAATPAFATGAAPTRIERSVDFDPRRFDPSAYFSRAQAFARTVMPDAALTVMTFHSVLPSGLVDLDVADTGDVTYTFRSPSRSRRPPGVPRAAPFRSACMVTVAISKVTMSAAIGTAGCDDEIVAPPRCTTADVWKAALAEGVAGDRRAVIEWAADRRVIAGGARGKSAPRWSFSTATPTQSVVGAAMATYDDCAGATPTAARPSGPR